MKERREGKDLQLAQLLLWLEWPAGSKGTCARDDDWDGEMSGRKFGGEDLCDPMKEGPERKGRQSR